MTEVQARLPYDSQRAIDELKDADPRLGLLMSLVGEYTMDYRPALHPFEALCRSIAYQQLSGRAASTIFGRFCDLLKEEGVRPHAVMELSHESMRAVGLSNAKCLAIQDLARKTIDGVVPSSETIMDVSDDELMDRLTSVKGIGRWTVEMLMMFRLGRPDVLPATDLGIRKGFRILYDQIELPKPKHILEYGERWKPYRTIASWYLWRAVDLDADVLPPY